MQAAAPQREPQRAANLFHARFRQLRHALAQQALANSLNILQVYNAGRLHAIFNIECDF